MEKYDAIENSDEDEDDPFYKARPKKSKSVALRRKVETLRFTVPEQPTFERREAGRPAGIREQWVQEQVQKKIEVGDSGYMTFS